MTIRHSESPHCPAPAATGADFSSNGATSCNPLPHHAFAKTDPGAARQAFRYPAATAATGASTSQVVSDERSTVPRTSGGHPVSHCEVTEWHRSVTWGMRNGIANRRQHCGGSDDRRY